uniref:WW domain-binding protein 4 n=1 Tax=Euleptes europaea TaxID=460621 RepID=UPI0025405190|nr:WW domain-binding protein 4 [Euleptes europaea]
MQALRSATATASNRSSSRPTPGSPRSSLHTEDGSLHTADMVVAIRSTHRLSSGALPGDGGSASPRLPPSPPRQPPPTAASGRGLLGGGPSPRLAPEGGGVRERRETCASGRIGPPRDPSALFWFFFSRADYWKSQPKKFCDYCKCWIADNKPSIEFHERGKNHKENVAKKISEIKKKSLDKAKQEEKMSKEFAAMEEAAMKAYQEDLKRLGVKTEPVSPVPPKKQEEKREKKEKRKKERKAPEASSRETKVWVRGFSSEGYMYYYNTISGESQWEKPEGFGDDPQESQMPGQWVEGVSEDGQTYYYNTETGVSSWEKPDGFVSSSNESCQEESCSGEGREAESMGTESDAGKEGRQMEQRKPQRVIQRKTESDEEGEEKPRRPKKFSPYGEWQAVKPERVEPEDRAPAPRKTTQAASATAKPYGEWEEITKEEDPYEKVDLELPNTENDFLPAPVLQAPEDAKMIFKEKTVTSLSDTTAGESVFKKRKFENGKSRNIRQRLDDH